MKPDESWGAIVAYYDPHAQAPCFRRYYGLLFGLPNAVTSFNHVESLASLLSSCSSAPWWHSAMYFDDLLAQDWKSARGSAQIC